MTFLIFTLLGVTLYLLTRLLFVVSAEAFFFVYTIGFLVGGINLIYTSWMNIKTNRPSFKSYIKAWFSGRLKVDI